MNVRILVLGILMCRPAHGYEIQQYLQLHEVEQWSGILPGSTYHALKKMREEGLVALERTEVNGGRSKEVYAITPEGQRAFRALLLEAWRAWKPGLPMTWFVALSFVDGLAREQTLTAVRAQIGVLERELAQIDRVPLEELGGMAQHAGEGVVPPFVELMLDNARAHVEADLRLLRALEARLPGASLAPLRLPSLEELIEKHPHLRERLRVDSRKERKMEENV